MEGVEAHEAAVGGLVEGVVAEELAGVAYGGGVGALVLEEMGEAFEGVEVGLEEALAVGEEPVVVATG
jgi:hypothetical protein